MYPTVILRLGVISIAGLCPVTAGAADETWQRVAPGVEYRHVMRHGLDAHAVRVNLDDGCVRVVASTSGERGLTVSDFARRRAATVAVNGDYFDEHLDPVGFAMGDGVVWARASERRRRQEVVGVGGSRVEIFPRAAPLREPEPWMTGAVSGWPMLVSHCRSESRLPGSDIFTRAPHARTAVGLSDDGRRLLVLVADGGREHVPGPTLPELAGLLVELGACTALNLDGGGSSALWVDDHIVNHPSDGFERPVGNQLAVVMAPGCDCRRLPETEHEPPEDACGPRALRTDVTGPSATIPPP
jgi:exopolysaccharide biosynthesis protein